jgi:DUF4097 and DUF4098 domain-containing protein YvlB
MRVRVGVLLAGLCLVAAPLRAQVGWELGDQSWCDPGDGGVRSARFCEVRTTTLPASGRLEVDGGPNGGIEIEAWTGQQVEVVARLSASAPSEGRAEELVRGVDISADSERIAASGPDTGRRESWAVSYRLRVPRDTDLALRTTNGGIEIAGVDGDIDFRTTNGGVDLADLAGNVRGRTTNGGLRVELGGAAWSGEGLDVQTTNGGVTLMIPENYSAELELATTNGRVNVDFPITVQGRIGRQMRTTLGDGGRPLRAVTTNGGVRVARR